MYLIHLERYKKIPQETHKLAVKNIQILSTELAVQ